MLTGRKVDQLIRECLFKTDEPKENALVARMIRCEFGFHPGRIEERREEINKLLDQLPDQFHQDRGGGWSFLNACDDNKGRQWTGDHAMMEALFALGTAIGRVKALAPRNCWSLLPGGVPYYVVEARFQA